MGAMVSQLTSLTIVYSTVYSCADQTKHQSSASLAFVGWIHRWLANSPHKWPVTRKMFPFDDVIMWTKWRCIFRFPHNNSHAEGLVHYNDVTMSAMVSQITGVSIVYSTICLHTAPCDSWRVSANIKDCPNLLQYMRWSMCKYDTCCIGLLRHVTGMLANPTCSISSKSSMK